MAARLIGLLTACALIAPASAAGSVLYVGDSLGVGTAPYLRQQLDEALRVDAESGRPSAPGVEVLSSLIGPQHDVVVFDLGTNDSSPDDYASSLAAARGIAGDRCLVLATLNRPPLNGSPVEPLDRVLARFATRSPNVELVDWRGAVAQRPELLTDGIHATPEGYSLRADLFADAIESCLPLGPTSADDFRGEGRGAGRQTDTHASEPEPRLARDHSRRPLDVVAVELAKAIAVGAEFG